MEEIKVDNNVVVILDDLKNYWNCPTRGDVIKRLVNIYQSKNSKV